VQEQTEKLPPITEPSDKVPDWIPFRIDELYPLKGQWYRISEIRDDRLTLLKNGIARKTPPAGWAPLAVKDLIRHKGFMFAVAEIHDDHIVIVPLYRIPKNKNKGRFQA
jgi:hypothetical protein